MRAGFVCHTLQCTCGPFLLRSSVVDVLRRGAIPAYFVTCNNRRLRKSRVAHHEDILVPGDPCAAAVRVGYADCTLLCASGHDCALLLAMLTVHYCAHKVMTTVDMLRSKRLVRAFAHSRCQWEDLCGLYAYLLGSRLPDVGVSKGDAATYKMPVHSSEILSELQPKWHVCVVRDCHVLLATKPPWGLGRE